MIEHEGIVTAVNSNQVTVKILQQAACSGCKAKSACMAADNREKQVDANTQENLQVGDKVIVYGRESIGRRAVLFAYILPLVILLAIIIVMGHFVNNEVLVGITALLALIPYCLFLFLGEKKLKHELQFSATKTKNN